MPRGVPKSGKRAPWGSVKAAREQLQQLGITPSYGNAGGSVVPFTPQVPVAIPEIEESDEDINKRIAKTFRVLDKMASGVVEGSVPSLIVSGAPGCGKSYSIETKLEQAASAGVVDKTDIIKGSMSAKGLYAELYEHKGKRDILVIDDCDSIFASLEALNLLKSALDTKRVRTIHWTKELKGEDALPQKFVFEGSLIFISNLNFPAMIDAENRMSEHYKAFVDRSILVDLGIHTRREVLHRIRQVVYEDAFLAQNNMKLEVAQTAFKWIFKNIDRLRTLSIRTVLQLGMLIKNDPEEWESSAEVTLIRRYKKVG